MFWCCMRMVHWSASIFHQCTIRYWDGDNFLPAWGNLVGKLKEILWLTLLFSLSPNLCCFFYLPLPQELRRVIHQALTAEPSGFHLLITSTPWGSVSGPFWIINLTKRWPANMCCFDIHASSEFARDLANVQSPLLLPCSGSHGNVT